jgi:hypothetical protein
VRSANGALTPNRLSEGIPAVPAGDIGNGIIDLPPNVTTITMPDEFDRGYIKSFNLSLQRQLFKSLVGEVAYIGTRQIRQLQYLELNWSPVGGGQAGRQFNNPAFNNRAVDTLVIAPGGDSDYNALQARLSRRFNSGWSFDVNYTLSKSMSDSGQPDSDNTPRINIPDLYHLNRALSNFDRTHNLQITSLAELPFGKDKRWLNNGGVLSAIAGGWQVNNIVSVMSGTPFSVTADSASVNAPGSNNQRADRLKDNVDILGGVGRGNAYFDVLAFGDPAITTPGQFRFGTASYNSMRGPGIVRWDVGLFRQFRASDRVNVQFRAECFNCTNTPHFNNPGGNRSSLQLNPDGSIRNLNGFGEITGTRADFPARVIRFGMRLGF